MDKKELKELMKETVLDMVKNNELLVKQVEEDGYSNEGGRYDTKHFVLVARKDIYNEFYEYIDTVEVQNETNYATEFWNNRPANMW